MWILCIFLKIKNKKHLKIWHSSYFKIYSFLYYKSYILLSQRQEQLMVEKKKLQLKGFVLPNLVKLLNVGLRNSFGFYSQETKKT